MVDSGFNQAAAGEWEKRPQPYGCRLMDWDEVKIVGGFAGTYVAIVSGTKKSPATGVHLSLRTYVHQPDYWGIEVIGCMNGIDFVPNEKYTVTSPANLGTKGIEIIGANKREKFDVPPK